LNSPLPLRCGSVAKEKEALRGIVWVVLLARCTSRTMTGSAFPSPAKRGKVPTAGAGAPANSDKTAGLPFCTATAARRAKRMDALSAPDPKGERHGWRESRGWGRSCPCCSARKAPPSACAATRSPPFRPAGTFPRCAGEGNLKWISNGAGAPAPSMALALRAAVAVHNGNPAVVSPATQGKRTANVRRAERTQPHAA
jgi:hypothetical protein